MSNENKFSAGTFFLLFSVLSIIACVGFLYKLHKGIVLNPRCIEVSAEAEKIISADRATWTISFDRTDSDQKKLNKLLLADRNVVQKFFETNGIKKEDAVEQILNLFTRTKSNKEFIDKIGRIRSNKFN